MSRLIENGCKSVNPRGYQGSQGWLWWAFTLVEASFGLAFSPFLDPAEMLGF
jgi:hypothetical protein